MIYSVASTLKRRDQVSQDRIIAEMQSGEVLDPLQLEQLEHCFRTWAEDSTVKRRKASRRRILLIFLLIRYTGAKLSEVLTLQPMTDIDITGQTVTYRSGGGEQARQAAISQSLALELKALLSQHQTQTEEFFAVDPAYVRKKFYERAYECGFEKTQGGPEMLRRARAVELMRNNMPLPAVQRLLGHSSPSLTTSRISFSDEDVREVTRMYMERESGRKTSARNTFFGKVLQLEKGDVQTLVELVTADGGTISALITNTSCQRMGLRPGRLVTAEIKSPWLILERCDRPGSSSAENQRDGAISRITAGTLNTECAVNLPDGTELCSIMTTRGFKQLALNEGEPVRVLFGAYSVIIHVS